MITKAGFLSRVKRKKYYCKALEEEVNIRAMGAREAARMAVLLSASDGVEQAEAGIDGAFYVLSCCVENEDNTPMFDGADDEVLCLVGTGVVTELFQEICSLSGMTGDNDADVVADPLES